MNWLCAGMIYCFLKRVLLISLELGFGPLGMVSDDWVWVEAEFLDLWY